MNFDRVQPKQQVLAKISRLYLSARRSAFVAEIIRTSTFCVFEEPTRSSSPVSSTRSNLACCRIGMFAISSRNKRAAIRQLKAADAVCPRISERALHVTEKLALKCPLRQRAGIHRHQRAVRPR